MSGRECGLSVPSSARIYDYLFGGKDNYEVDRAIGDELLAVCPALGLNLRWMDAFVGRAVEYVAALGVRQFADLGCGYPRTPSPYARVQRAHAVHIDCDPVVAAHGNALLQSPTSLFIDADITETAALAGHLGMLLDLGRPVAAVLGSVLEYLPDPGRVLGELSKTLAPGSYVVISHITADWAPAVERLRDVLGACGIAFVLAAATRSRLY
ncbi:SAM-dependent methyltransferase [Nocardia sp. IFM 10818]